MQKIKALWLSKEIFWNQLSLFLVIIILYYLRYWNFWRNTNLQCWNGLAKVKQLYNKSSGTIISKLHQQLKLSLVANLVVKIYIEESLFSQLRRFHTWCSPQISLIFLIQWLLVQTLKISFYKNLFKSYKETNLFRRF